MDDALPSPDAYFWKQVEVPEEGFENFLEEPEMCTSNNSSIQASPLNSSKKKSKNITQHTLTACFTMSSLSVVGLELLCEEA